MNATKMKNKKRILRHQRVRSKIFGTRERPRLSVFRSLKHVFLQLIDDSAGRTIVSVSSCDLKKNKDNPYQGKTAAAYETGRQLAKLAKEKDIKQIAFDRGGNSYHGRIKALAEGARAGGLIF